MLPKPTWPLPSCAPRFCHFRCVKKEVPSKAMPIPVANCMSWISSWEIYMNQLTSTSINQLYMVNWVWFINMDPQISTVILVEPLGRSVSQTLWSFGGSISPSYGSGPHKAPETFHSAPADGSANHQFGSTLSINVTGWSTYPTFSTFWLVYQIDFQSPLVSSPSFILDCYVHNLTSESKKSPVSKRKWLADPPVNRDRRGGITAAVGWLLLFCGNQELRIFVP